MYLHRIRINNVRGFSGRRSVDLSFERDKNAELFARYAGWTVIAGRNGAGKTSLLRAIALTLAGPEMAGTLTEGESDWISRGHELAMVQATIRRDGYELNVGQGRPTNSFTASLAWNSEDGPRPRPRPNWTGAQGGKMAERSLWAPTPLGWFAAGYGPFRRLAGTGSEVARLMAGDYTASRFVTLFREEASLAETVQWLQQLNYRARSNRAGYAELETQVHAVLNDGLLPEGHVITHVDPDGVWVGREGAASIRIDEMSDGYRTVTALVADIVKQIHQCFNGKLEWNQNGKPILENSGVVLIDEVDVHLHVSWQKRIGPWLVKHFPFIQFIVSTHSPYVCQTAGKRGLIRLPGIDDEFATEVVSEDLYARVVNGTADDAVLTELFGLESPYSARAEQLRQRMTQLEREVLSRRASEAQRAEYFSLVNLIQPSPLSRAMDVVRERDR